MVFFKNMPNAILYATPDPDEDGSGSSGQADPQEDDKVHSDG